MIHRNPETARIGTTETAPGFEERPDDQFAPSLETAPSQTVFQLGVRPATVAKWLVIVVCTLAVTGTIANLVIYQVAPTPEHKVARLMHRFDLGHEPSLPAWYSSLALLAASLLLATIGLKKRRMADSYARHWLGLSLIFLLLAVDESVMFHEMLGNIVPPSLRPGGAFFFPWVIPAMLGVTVIGLLYLRFLVHLERRTRWLFVIAGTLFVGGAVGMEMVSAAIIEQHGMASVGDVSSELIAEHGVSSLGHTFSQTIEETLEMLGIVLFIYALLDYLGCHVGILQIRITNDVAGATNRSLSIRTSA